LGFVVSKGSVVGIAVVGGTVGTVVGCVVGCVVGFIVGCVWVWVGTVSVVFSPGFVCDGSVGVVRMHPHKENKTVNAIRAANILFIYSLFQDN
jgi:carbon starvation protein CstA